MAVLGLQACPRATVPESRWVRLLRSQCRLQDADGRWGYFNKPRQGAAAYPCGTFMGTSVLLAATHAVGDSKAMPKSLRPKAAAARRRALLALSGDGKAFLKALSAGADLEEGICSVRPYYCLVALERACLLAGIKHLGGLPWYATGARALLSRQAADGSWAPIAG
jgi:hypothetical protein